MGLKKKATKKAPRPRPITMTDLERTKGVLVAVLERMEQEDEACPAKPWVLQRCGLVLAGLLLTRCDEAGVMRLSALSLMNQIAALIAPEHHAAATAKVAAERREVDVLERMQSDA